TDQGYRYYVDNLIDSRKPSRAEVARIDDELLSNEALSSPEVLMERTSHLLSELSSNVGIVVRPSGTTDFLHHIEFVKLPDSRVLAITVSSSGRVQHRLISVDSELEQEELNST